MPQKPEPPLSSQQAEDKLKLDFVALVSHELRTPVSAILGYIELFLEQTYGPLTEEQEKTLTYMGQNARDLMRMVNDLLELTNIQAGRAQLTLETVSLQELAKKVLAHLKPLHRDKPIKVSAHVSEDLPPMRTDSLKVKQILINLVSNALKFTREGEITIVANPIPSPTGDDAAWLQLEVRDTGVGIPKDKLDRLFKIFSQVDNRISREYEGIGLGLYISQYLAQMLGGDISVTSEVGRGTTFIVRLPVELENVGVVRRLAQLSKATVNAAEPLSVQPEPVTLAPGQQCVLVIGTSPDLARLLGDSLKKEGLQALKATSYETALKAITDAKPQAVFVDLTHSQSEAWQILQQLRLHPDAQNLPVIYLTDYGEAPPASGAGAPLAVTAPLQPQQVVDSVRKAGNQNTKILVADDEDSFRSVLETILRDEGYQVSLAKDGREALEKLERERPHVLLLDLNMPVMSGWEVIRAICDKPAVRDTRVVIMTGQVMSDEDTKLISQNIQGFLKKSEFRIEKILAEVRAVMQNA